MSRPGRGLSVAFSPQYETVLAVAGDKIGTELVDLRNPK